jgi:hypothetical protein
MAGDAPKRDPTAVNDTRCSEKTWLTLFITNLLLVAPV